MGRTIGYPTANIAVNDSQKIVPGKGVYAVRIQISDKAYQGNDFGGMMNIGVRPTVDGTKEVIEVNIFDLDADIYGMQVTVWFHRRLRAERKFSGLEELKEQLAKDKLEARQALL